ncbi:hypothetical protein [Methanothrix sp.]
MKTFILQMALLSALLSGLKTGACAMLLSIRRSAGAPSNGDA